MDRKQLEGESRGGAGVERKRGSLEGSSNGAAIVTVAEPVSPSSPVTSLCFVHTRKHTGSETETQNGDRQHVWTGGYY